MPPPFAESQDPARRGQPPYSSEEAKLETRGPWVFTGLSMTLFLIIVDLRRPHVTGCRSLYTDVHEHATS